MAHLRIALSPEAFARLREISRTTGRELWVDAGLLLESALRKSTVDDAAALNYRRIVSPPTTRTP